jgi:hypothetical protein
MFSLDRAIADWRGHLAHYGLHSAELLDELECHLRDDIENSVSAEMTLEEAFADAALRIGQPTLLRGEFNKLSVLQLFHERTKQAFLTLAGIPDSYLNPSMKTSSAPTFEPAWATYLKNGAFVGPALFLWTATAIFVLPKLEQICRDAGVSSDFAIWRITRSNFTAMILFRDYGALCLAALLVGFVVLEWRSANWPRYRRATLGIGAFALNFFVLVSIFFMIIAATAAAPALLQHAR